MDWITEVREKDFKKGDWIAFKSKFMNTIELGVVEFVGGVKDIYIPANDESEDFKTIEKYVILPKL